MGTSVDKGEPAMDTHDWRDQLPFGSCLKIVNKIMEILHKHLPFSGPEGMNEVRRIASRLEEKIFSGAVSQTDYLRRISLKMPTMDTKAPNAAGPSSGHFTRETAIDTHDWRVQLPSGSRQKIVNMIMETIHRHLPVSGPAEGMEELRRIASRFEEKIFSSAVSQNDYLRKISMKMLTMDTREPNAAGPSSSLPICGAYNRLPLNPDIGFHQLTVEGPVKAEPAVNTGDWRTCIAPYSRKKNANKIEGTLKKHVPNCGEEGNKELERIAASFEELIFNAASDQVDYFRKISFKMQTTNAGQLMDNNNWRFALPKTEPDMETNNWRTHLPPDSRQKIVNDITEKLMKHLPLSGAEGMNELTKIASRFEEKIFSGAVSQTDYHRKISMKLPLMETKAPNAAGPSSSLPICGVYSRLPLNPGQLMDNNNWRFALPKTEPGMETNDWRTHLPPDSRHKIVNDITEKLMKHLPLSGAEGMNELTKIASRFEEKIFSGAVSQTDYHRKISMKLLLMDTKAPNAAGPSSSLPICGAYSPLPLNPDCPQMTVEGPVKAEPVVNTGDWRTCLPPGSRKKNANKIKGTLQKHVPNCGKEGNKELKKIAASFEELIFNTAIDQVDYLHKTSFKITP